MTVSDSTTPVTPAPSDYVGLSSFDELPLSAETRAAIAAKGYTKPTPVQAASLRPILAGRDVIVRSKTGTGKTAAFGIPVVEMVDPALPYVQAICLCNTRELALQVAGELADLGRNKGVKVVAIYGGSSMDSQLQQLRDGAVIVVGTPGRIIDLIDRRTLVLDKTKIGVLDEADEMLGEGFFQDVMKILGKLPAKHQTLLFSATVTADLQQIIEKHLHEPETILLSGDVYTVEGITNIFYYAQDAYPKPRNLLYMLQLENPTSAIVFCNTRDDVNLICTVLNRNGFDADKLSGELAQSERERVMARIKRGELQFMVATDIAARGIDISDLTHVINYSLPEDPSTYLHRVGRTGRIGKTGTALSLVRGPELVTLSALQKKFGITFTEKKLPNPEEAHKMWVNSHLDELRTAQSSLLFDAYVPLAQDLKQRDGGELLIAFALKYFFNHHRMEKAATTQPVEESKTAEPKPAAEPKKKEAKARLQERRTERARPVLEGSPEAAPAEAAPAAPAPRAEKAEAAPAPGNRVYIGLGTVDGLDADAVKAAILELIGVDAGTILKLDVLGTHSYADVDPATVPTYLAANGKTFKDKVIKVEVARPRTSSSRRRR
jgi:ATP-dependent RNA helicase DeaD